jgi:hypothetical protein
MRMRQSPELYILECLYLFDNLNDQRSMSAYMSLVISFYVFFMTRQKCAAYRGGAKGGGGAEPSLQSSGSQKNIES